MKKSTSAMLAVLLATATAVMLAVQLAPFATRAANGADADKLYVEARASDIKVSPSQFVGKDLSIRDYFGRLMSSKDRDDRRELRRKGWAKTNKVRFDHYVIFYTDQYNNLGSGMRCYLKRTDENKDMVKMVTTELKPNDPILLKGRVVAYDLGERAGDPDITHFVVDEIIRGHKELEKAKKIIVAVGKQRMEISRTGKFDFSCPVCKKHIFFIRWHSLEANFDLEIKCPHCESKITYHFTSE